MPSMLVSAGEVLLGDLALEAGVLADSFDRLAAAIANSY